MRIWTTEDWYGKNPSKTYPKFIENFSRQTRYRVGAFIAHFYFRDDLAVTNRHTYINLVRHPVERVISHYFYMRNSKLRSKERLLEFRLRGQWNESLRDCVMHQHFECRDNLMTRFFCGPHEMCKTGSPQALQRAKYNIKKHYASSGLPSV